MKSLYYYFCQSYKIWFVKSNLSSFFLKFVKTGYHCLIFQFVFTYAATNKVRKKRRNFSNAIYFGRLKMSSVVFSKGQQFGCFEWSVLFTVSVSIWEHVLRWRRRRLRSLT